MKNYYSSRKTILLLLLILAAGTTAIAQNGWERLNDMSIANAWIASDTLDNIVYVVGGDANYAEAYNTLTGTWTAMPGTNRIKISTSVSALDNKIYAIGGWEGEGSDSSFVEVYDPVENTWTLKSQLPVQLWNQVSVSLNDTIYVIGGAPYNVNGRATSIYDPVADSLITLPQMHESRMFPAHCTYNNKIYVFGGVAPIGSNKKSVEVYDPVTKTWEELADMPVALYGQKACVHNDKIILFGGDNGPGEINPIDYVLEYDPVSDEWSILKDMPFVRSLGASATIGPYFYLFGGYDEPSRENPLADALRFNLDYLEGKPDPYAGLGECEYINGSWDTVKHHVPGIRTAATSCVVDEKIYLIGGYTGWEEESLNYYTEIEVYDPLTDTWDATSRAPLPLGRAFPAACVLDEKIYVASGMSFNDTTDATLWICYPDMHVYDPLADVWETLASLPDSVYTGGLAAIDGKIYTAGCWKKSPTGSIPDAYVYDPVADSWSAIADMTYASFGRTIHALDEKMYAIGGAFMLNEVYDPATDNWSSLPYLPSICHNSASCVLNGEIYMIGGELELHGGYLRTMHKYNPESNKWIYLDSIPDYTLQAAATAVDGKIYLMGGGNNIEEERLVSDIVWQYKPFHLRQKDLIPTQEIVVGNSAMIDMPHYFEFNDINLVEFSICSNSDEGVVDVSILSGRLTLSALTEGIADISIQAKYCAEITGTDFQVNVGPAALEENEQPQNLISIYPNPFSGITSVQYTLEEHTTVRIEIYNCLGKQVAVLVNKPQDPGSYTIPWNAEDMYPGIYFCILILNNKQQTRKLIVSQ